MAKKGVDTVNDEKCIWLYEVYSVGKILGTFGSREWIWICSGKKVKPLVLTQHKKISIHV